MKLKFLYLAIGLFILQACCTKKGCECETLPFITFNISGFNVADKSNFYAVHIDTNTLAPIDSIHLGYALDTSTHNSLTFSPGCLQVGCGGIYRYVIVNRPAGFADTISKIVTINSSYSFECNECILTKDVHECSEEKILSITAHGKTYAPNDFSYTLVNK